MLYKDDELINFSNSFENYYQELTKLANLYSINELLSFKEVLRKVFDFAKESHQGQYRKRNNIAYITHPIHVSLLVAQFNNIDLIIAALLHDVVEDTEVNLDDLKSLFNLVVVDLVEILTKPDLLENESKHTRAKRMFDKLRNASKDENLIKNALIIKLADRFTNLQTIEALNPKRIEEYLIETEKYLLTIAKEFQVDFLTSEIIETIRRIRS